MQRMWAQLEKEGIGLLAVHSGEVEELQLEAFIEQFKLTFPVVLDPDTNLSKAWGVGHLPTSFVISSDGRMIYRVTGELQWDDETTMQMIRDLNLE